jgi:hypothetical protein
MWGQSSGIQVSAKPFSQVTEHKLGGTRNASLLQKLALRDIASVTEYTMNQCPGAAKRVEAIEAT